MTMPILCFCASFLLVRYQSNSEFGYSKQLRDRTRLGLLHLDKQINEERLDWREEDLIDLFGKKTIH